MVPEKNNLLPSRKGLTGAACCSLLPHSKYFYLIWMKCIIFLMKGFFPKGCFPSVQRLPLLGSTHAVLGRGFSLPEITPGSVLKSRHRVLQRPRAQVSPCDPRTVRPPATAGAPWLQCPQLWPCLSPGYGSSGHPVWSHGRTDFWKTGDENESSPNSRGRPP